MQRFIVVFMAVWALFAALSLSACGGDEPAPAAPSQPEKPVATNTLERVMEEGRLVAGVSDDLPPFGYLPEGSKEPVGFDVDLVRALAKVLGVTPEFVVLRTAERLPALTTGRVDLVAAGLEHTFQREDSVDFSLAVFMDGQKLLVHRGSGIRDASDLKGLAAAAIQDSGDAERLSATGPDKLAIKPYSGYIKAFLALKSGEVQALTADVTILLRLRATDVHPELWKIVGPYLSRSPYALALPENQSDFRDAVNKGLADLRASGEFQRIYEKWFGPQSKHPLPLDFAFEAWPTAP
jgi:polar amino acid transport system substrate-binding protein